MYKKKNIGALLIECGKITSDDLEEGLRIQKELHLKLGETLIKLGKVTKDDIEWILSKQLDIPFVIVENISLDPGLISKFPRELLVKSKVLPLYETDDEIAIATDDPLNGDVFEAIQALSGKKIKLSSGNGEKIEEILVQFFKGEGVPSLIRYIQSLVEKIEGTTFYRIDFILDKNSCGINVYGSGILRKLAVLDAPYKREQVFDSFESLNIAFLYDVYSNGSSLFLSIYPVTQTCDSIRFPSIVGTFGLVFPGDITFTDAQVERLPYFFSSGNPVKGHIFLSTKGRISGYEKTIFTTDSAPSDFSRFYIKTAIPETCGSCSGKGCERCNELGYLFDRRLEGIYSSADLKKMTNEVERWQK